MFDNLLEVGFGLFLIFQVQIEVQGRRIRGRTGRTRGPMIAKSISIKGQGGKFGRCVAKAAVLTSGGLDRVPESGLRGS